MTKKPPSPSSVEAVAHWERGLPVDPARRRAFVEELAAVAVELRMADAIEASGLSRSEIATRLGVSRPHVTQLCGSGNRGPANSTIRALARLADAINCDLEVSFVPRPLPKPPRRVRVTATSIAAPVKYPRKGRSR